MDKTTPLNSSIGHILVKIIKLKRKIIDQKMKEYQLSRSAWLTLCALNRVLKPCSQKLLAEELDLDPAQMVRILDELEQNGNIFRVRSKEDRRCQLVNLSPLAKTKLIPFVNQAINEESQIMFHNFTPEELSLFKNSLNKVEYNLLQYLEGKK